MQRFIGLPKADLKVSVNKVFHKCHSERGNVNGKASARGNEGHVRTFTSRERRSIKAFDTSAKGVVGGIKKIDKSLTSIVGKVGFHFYCTDQSEAFPNFP